MADKYAAKRTQPELSPEERVANILQARMPWPLAEACARSLAYAGLPSTDRLQAIAVLHEHVSRSRAVACANDLAMYDLVPREQEERHG